MVLVVSSDVAADCDPTAIIAKTEALSEALSQARKMVSARFIGQEQVVELVLGAMLTGGHALLVGLPGLGKTRLVETLGHVMGLQANRIQFTPDLMPADILGAEVLESDQAGQRAFRFIEGPIFCQLLLADEINRASPRSQSALLQAMQEHEVTIAGKARPLGRPFHVLATQNPLEQEGTYPLPEAQLDRFLVQVDLGYPSRAVEEAILLATTGVLNAKVSQVFDSETLLDAQHLLRQMPVGQSVVDAILDLVRGLRPDQPEGADLAQHLAWGPGPRAAQALMLMVRARALLTGRLAPSLEDVAALAKPCLHHRMSLSFGARAQGIRLEDLIAAKVAKL